MPTSTFPGYGLLLGGLLLGATTAAAQGAPDGSNNPLYRSPKPLLPSQSREQGRPTTTTSVLESPLFPLLPEPDSIARRLFAQQRVRAVIRLRLDAEGQVKDTVGYQAIDPHGYQLVRTAGGRQATAQRRWSYNPEGACLSQFESASQLRPFATLSSYDPAQGQGTQQALLSDGSHPVLTEARRYQHGDTTLTELHAHLLYINGRAYGQDRLTRRFEYAPHPDTLLTVSFSYDPKGRLTASQAAYVLRHHGQLREEGNLSMSKVLRLLPTRAARENSAVLGAARQLLRRQEGRTVTASYAYDSHHRMIRHDQVLPGGSGSVSKIERSFTYNTLNQLIGREEIIVGARNSVSTRYTVYSYSPEGLIVGETTDARNNYPTFYRYQYQYYE